MSSLMHSDVNSIAYVLYLNLFQLYLFCHSDFRSTNVSSSSPVTVLRNFRDAVQMLHSVPPHFQLSCCFFLGLASHVLVFHVHKDAPVPLVPQKFLRHNVLSAIWQASLLVSYTKWNFSVIQQNLLTSFCPIFWHLRFPSLLILTSLLVLFSLHGCPTSLIIRMLHAKSKASLIFTSRTFSISFCIATNQMNLILCSRIIHQKPTVIQLVQKLPIPFGTIAVFTRALQWGSVLSQMIRVHILLYSSPTYAFVFQVVCSLRFPNQHFVSFLVNPLHDACAICLFDQPSNIWWILQIMVLSEPPVTSLVLGQNILSSTLFANI